MERGYEIIISSEDLKEKEILGIEYPFYKDKYLDIIRIFLENCKKVKRNMQENSSNNKEMFNAYEKFPNDMGNVITIIGGRGSGKTTVLQEIRTILMDFGYGREYIKAEWIKRLGMTHRKNLEEAAKQKFTISAMEVIDASALEEKDDLLEIILWHICNDVKKKLEADVREEQCDIREWDRQKFLEILDEVYRMHQSVKGKAGRIAGGESVLTALENMPNSIKTRNAMHELLDMYCKIMFPGNEQNSYLVIAIDDLDLNIQKSYQILEEIRRYLLDWRIIVLLAVDNKQMEEACITHFYNEFGVKRFGSDKGELSSHIHDLSNSYLLKAMTVRNRIYLSEETFQTAQIAQRQGSDYMIWDIKKYLLFNIARKMHIFYDAHGLKRHFCEPDNIRELISYIDFLKSMHTIDWNVPEGEQPERHLEQQLEYYNQNYMRFYQDIAGRMAFQILQYEQNDIFNELKKRDSERRTGYVLQWYKYSLQEKGTSKAIKEMEHFDFGEFVGCLYLWGRNDYEFKTLVHCLLASFTSEMTKEYFNYRCNLTNLESAKRSKRRLEGYVGDNVSGGWLSEEMGEVFWSERAQSDNKPVQEEDDAIINQNNRKSIAIEKEKEVQHIQFEYEIAANPKRNNAEEFIRLLNRIADAKILPILECLFLCLDNYKQTKEGDNWMPKIEIVGEQEPDISEKNSRRTKIKLMVGIRGTLYADFDILGFIKKSIDYQAWRNDIGKQLTSTLEQWAADMAGYRVEQDKVPERINKAVFQFEETSLFGGKENIYNEMALPLYNLDLSYNVLKRVRRRCQAEFSLPVEIDCVLERILRIYYFIEKELENEEMEYEGFDQSGRKFTYKDKFINDPYIVKFKELISETSSKSVLLKQMKMLYLGTGKIENLEQISPNLDI